MSAKQDNCPKCKMPKFASGSGSMTEWITCCRCDVVAHPDAQKYTLDLCSTCGKRISKGRAGSFTQFIFRFDLCSCDKSSLVPPRLTEGGQRRYVAQAESEREKLEEIEPDVGLSVNPETFPAERFRPLKRIGMGGAGNVYVCHDKLLNKRVALKTLHTLNAEQLLAFQNEARVLSKLDHPNIVRILDFGASEGGAPYMVLDYSSGAPLKGKLEATGSLDAETAHKVFMQLADALAYCHDHAVLHRDLKPENILFSVEPNGEPYAKLIDFGIALVADQEKTSMGGRVIAGTPAYMSPDQVLGHKYDNRSEIYSLGCVLFETLTGRPPFIADTALEVLSKHANDEPPDVAELTDQSIPQMLQDVVSTCLAKDPAKRFQNMRELASQLNRSRESESASTDELLPQTLGPSSSISKTKAAVAGGITLLMVASFCFLPQSQMKPLNPSGKVHRKDKFPTSDHAPEPVPGRDYKINRADAGEYYLQGNLTRDAFRDLARNYHPKIVEITPSANPDWKSLSELENCPDLEELSFSNTRFSDNECRFLSKFTHLEKLAIRNTKVTNAGIKTLASLPSLKSLRNLDIGETPTTGACISYLLKNLPDLEALDLENIDELTLDQLKQLKQFKHLRNLDVSSMAVGDAGAKILAPLNLEVLHMDGSDISDAAILCLAGKHLQKLGIGNNPKITDKSIPVILKMPDLRVLKTGGQTGMSTRGEALLAKGKPGLELRREIGSSGLSLHTEIGLPTAKDMHLLGDDLLTGDEAEKLK